VLVEYAFLYSVSWRRGNRGTESCINSNNENACLPDVGKQISSCGAQKKLVSSITLSTERSWSSTVWFSINL